VTTSLLNWMIVASIIGFISVGGGAFGAHGLANLLTEEQLNTFNLGTRYAQTHVVALLAIAFALQHWTNRALVGAAFFFTFGIVIFTGTLWGLAITGMGWLGAITPIGGLSLIIGWILTGVAAVRQKQHISDSPVPQKDVSG